MKVRTGFVSNSSSSSFAIWGASFGTDELLEVIKNQLTTEEYEMIKEQGESLKNVWSVDNLEMYEDYERQRIYIGRSWSDIDDDETGKQFKDCVQEKIEKAIGEKIECRNIETEIYC